VANKILFISAKRFMQQEYNNFESGNLNHFKDQYLNKNKKQKTKKQKDDGVWGKPSSIAQQNMC
jgi:hypothetical protein